jgi:hypothetical protein
MGRRFAIQKNQAVPFENLGLVALLVGIPVAKVACIDFTRNYFQSGSDHY